MTWSRRRIPELYDSFRKITPGEQDAPGMVTIGFTDRLTGERRFVRFDLAKEQTVTASSKLAGLMFADQMLDIGYRVAVLSDIALAAFFHAVGVDGATKPLPPDAVVTHLDTAAWLESNFVDHTTLADWFDELLADPRGTIALLKSETHQPERMH